MFIFRSSLAVGLAFVLTAAVSAAPNRLLAARGRNNSRNAITGTIVKVHHDRSPRGAGWIKIRRVHHHRHGRRGTSAAAAAFGRNRAGRGGRVTKIAVNSSTRFERLRQGGNRGAAAARTSFRAVRTGERVRIHRGSGRRHVAREVVILSNQSNRYGNRRYSNNGYSHGRRHGFYGRNSLVGSRVLSRHGRPQRFLTKRTVRTRVVVNRPVRHTLIEGRVTRQIHHKTAAHRIAAKTTKHPVKHGVKNHKPTPPKHTVVAKPHAPKHTAAHKHATTHPHSAGHKSSAHRKR